MPHKKGVAGKNTSSQLKSPSERSGFIRVDKFWKPKLTNNDFLEQYNRNGIAFKAINKISNDIFDNVFDMNNEAFDIMIKGFHLHDVVRSAYLNAKISKYSLIFIGYADGLEFDQPANVNAKIDYFYVIPRAWVSEDKFQEFNEVRDFYEIFEVSGSSFKVHESRVVRVDLGISSLEPAFNSLEVCDNILWGAGQTMFRAGQGFPVITIDSPELVNVDGEMIDEVTLLRKQGVLRDINTETGFIGDGRYNFDFKGAEGKAIKPGDYWTICITSAAMALEIPVQILEGVAAGAVTGSETNLRDYFSDISSKQRREAQPVYVELGGLFGLVLTDEDFDWLPLGELSSVEKSEVFNKDADSMTKLVGSGIISEDQALVALQTKFPELELESEGGNDSSHLSGSSSDVSQGIVVPKKNSSAFINGFYDRTCSCGKDQNEPLLTNRKTSGTFPKAEFKKLRVPLGTQDRTNARIENAFVRNLRKRYRALARAVLGVIQGFNTDSADTTDAINANTLRRLKTRLGEVFVNEKDVFGDVVNRFIDQSYVSGLDVSKKRLGTDPSLINFGKAEQAKRLLQGTGKQITDALLDSIEEEMGILLTDVSLGELSISNAQFRREIQNVFSRKLGRLESIGVSENNRTFNQALEFGFKADGLPTHKMWVAILDDRTTDICLHLHGEIVEIGKQFSTGDSGPPAHINCRSHLEPLTLSLAELENFKR